MGALVLFLLVGVTSCTEGGKQTDADPLPSWNDVSAKTAIVEFVAAVTNEGGKDYVKPRWLDHLAVIGVRYPESSGETPTGQEFTGLRMLKNILTHADQAHAKAVSLMSVTWAWFCIIDAPDAPHLAVVKDGHDRLLQFYRTC